MSGEGMETVWEKLGSFGIMALALAWIISAPLGMIYWGAKGWLLGVVLSLILPGFGVVSTVASAVG